MVADQGPRCTSWIASGVVVHVGVYIYTAANMSRSTLRLEPIARVAEAHSLGLPLRELASRPIASPPPPSRSHRFLPRPFLFSSQAALSAYPAQQSKTPALPFNGGRPQSSSNLNFDFCSLFERAIKFQWSGAMRGDGGCAEGRDGGIRGERSMRRHGWGYEALPCGAGRGVHGC